MATRKELGAKLMEEFGRLNDDIYECHRNYTGRSHTGSSSLALIGQACSGFAERLTQVRKSAEEYLALAPEMRSQFEYDASETASAIREFRNSTGGVHHDTLVKERELDDPHRPTGGGFARRTGPNELTTAQDSVVPVIRHVPSGLFSTSPVVVGHAHQRVVQTHDNRGRVTGMTVFDRDMFGRRYMVR
jgi:hypothetical protein